MIKIFKLLCVAFCKWRSLQHPLINQREEDGHGLQLLPLKWSAVTCHPLYSKTRLLTWYKKCSFSTAQSAYNGWATNIFESAVCICVCEYAYVCIFTFTYTYTYTWGFPGSSAGKESTNNVGDLGSIPGLGRCPDGRHGNPIQCSYLENPHRQRRLVGNSP